MGLCRFDFFSRLRYNGRRSNRKVGSRIIPEVEEGVGVAKRWDALVPIAVIVGVMGLLVAQAYAPRYDSPWKRLDSRVGCFFALTFSEDGERIVGLSEFGRVLAWTQRTNTFTTIKDTKANVFETPWLSGRKRPVLSISANAERVAWASLNEDSAQGDVRVLDGASGKEVCRVQSNARSLALSPDGRRLAIDAPGQLTVVDTVSQTTTTLPLADHKLSPYGVRWLWGNQAVPRWMAWSPSGSVLALGAGDVKLFKVASKTGSSPSLTLWKRWSLTIGAKQFASPLLAVWMAFTSDNDLLVATRASPDADDARMELWDVEREQRERTFDVPDAAEFQLSRNVGAKQSASPLLVTVGSPVQKTIAVWQVSSGTLRQKWRPHAVMPFACAVSPDGSTIATGKFKGEIDLWRTPTGG
jgi:WD40 repeat protein